MLSDIQNIILLFWLKLYFEYEIYLSYKITILKMSGKYD